MRGGKVSNNLYELLLFSQVTCYAKLIPSSLMFFLCFSDPSFSFSATFTVNKYTLNLTWRDLGRPPWLALVVAPPLGRVLNFVCQKFLDMAEITEFRKIFAEIHF